MSSSSKVQTASEPLIETERLIQIIEYAKKKNIPDELLGSLWDLWDSHPEDCAEPPMVRSFNALTEVLKSFWEQDLKHELLNDTLYDEEGPEADHKLWEPQPEEEMREPKNLYQLFRKAWDQNRMKELIAMIEEYEDLLYGGSIEKAIMDSLELHGERETRGTSNA